MSSEPTEPEAVANIEVRTPLCQSLVAWENFSAGSDDSRLMIMILPSMMERCVFDSILLDLSNYEVVPVQLPVWTPQRNSLSSRTVDDIMAFAVAVSLAILLNFS